MIDLGAGALIPAGPRGNSGTLIRGSVGLQYKVDIRYLLLSPRRTSYLRRRLVEVVVGGVGDDGEFPPR